MKLVVNSIVHDLNVAVAQGLALAAEFDLNLDSVYDVLEENAVAAPYVKYKRGTFLGTSPVVAMNIDTVSKDYAKASMVGLGDRDLGSFAESFKAEHQDSSGKWSRILKSQQHLAGARGQSAS